MCKAIAIKERNLLNLFEFRLLLKVIQTSRLKTVKQIKGKAAAANKEAESGGGGYQGKGQGQGQC